MSAVAFHIAFANGGDDLIHPDKGDWHENMNPGERPVIQVTNENRGCCRRDHQQAENSACQFMRLCSLTPHQDIGTEEKRPDGDQHMDLNGEAGLGEIFDIHDHLLLDDRTQPSHAPSRQRVYANPQLPFVNRLEKRLPAVHDT